MTTTSIPGPISVVGQNPTLGPSATPYVGGPAAVSDSNPDLAPSMGYGGAGSFRDVRYLPRIGAGANVAGGYPNQDCGFFLSTGGLMCVDQVPSLAATNNIAAAQAAVSGTSLTLVTTTGAGVTVLAAALALPMPLGATIPRGACALDGASGYVGGGPSGGFQFLDPTKALARAVSITANGGATGGAIVVRGYDVYGAAMTETITAAASSTVNGKKAFKYVVSATPAFSDAGHTYALGTTDIFGLNIRVDRWAYARVFWNDTLETAVTGFVAGVTTTATATTGDTRGTYTQTSDGTKRLQVFAMPTVANMVASTIALATTGMFGVAQYAG